ncbi:tRNA (5-methylaminomethyl-2-thiouridine)(34)-methyltransferase MnmD [Panacibacter sp. DH6]|uniref:tRNA (5-methylaminomethyl-2-thiouridine)(34)-methyltransferase MnmD n=1 Tax=Panacibacter microcysteis TaxID=2793269 RepID=A0A931GVW9_9BACT|nr:tRNA (5-methylaminomethyl-2-thiouridine)(34)-methyltransferase MnmD [Panacibacter microcysteis]MBG9375568.1 tRNA (5-methylaminomethyl-2-thiouridine)(34)-methyltransferase MnmD [Panacibacter microcysteis]
MQRIIVQTKDGSPTIAVHGLNLTFHSIYGALQESKHVFIQAALEPLLPDKKTLHVFEMGFGTGLNALLTLHSAIKNGKHIYYEAAELFPLPEDLYTQLDYTPFFTEFDAYKTLQLLHRCAWNKASPINEVFVLQKVLCSLQAYTFTKQFDIVYFDAFDPAIQPELWTQQIFEKLYLAMHVNGILTTYSAKGTVRRNMQAAGFRVEKIPGAPGKREMLRAFKI